MMKNIIFFVLALYMTMNAFAQTKGNENIYMPNKNNDTTNCSIIKSYTEIEKKTYTKVFEVEAPRDGSYYISFWLVGVQQNNKFLKYNLQSNNNKRYNIKPQTGGWHCLILLNNDEAQQIQLAKGNNRISFISNENIPQIENLKVSIKYENVICDDSTYLKSIDSINQANANKTAQSNKKTINEPTQLKNKQKEGMSIYLTKYIHHSSYKEFKADTAVLETTPFISYNQIVNYDTTNHIIALSANIKNLTLDSIKKLSNRSFVVTLNKKPLYCGKLWSNNLSTNSDWVLVYLDEAKYVTQNKIKLQLGTGQGYTIDNDPRNNPSLFQQLTKDKKVKHSKKQKQLKNKKNKDKKVKDATKQKQAKKVKDNKQKPNKKAVSKNKQNKDKNNNTQKKGKKVKKTKKQNKDKK